MIGLEGKHIMTPYKAETILALADNDALTVGQTIEDCVEDFGSQFTDWQALERSGILSDVVQEGDIEKAEQTLDENERRIAEMPPAAATAALMAQMGMDPEEADLLKAELKGEM